jgi:hypothetical protein
MRSSDILTLQKFLVKKGFTKVEPDGIAGPITMAAVNSLKGIDPSWDDRKKLVAAIQTIALENDIPTGKVDGLWGPQTAEASDSLELLYNTGSAPAPWRTDGQSTPAPANNWPIQNTASLTAFYGDPGPSQLVDVILPYPHKLSWDTGKVIHKFKAHAKVKDSIERVLSKVLAYYGLPEIQRLRLDIWGGCFNHRVMRGGTQLSTHSWGIAIDYDPDNNQLKWGRDRATFARPEYNKWWQFWEEEGWVSLGRTKNYDWMHVQAAR